MLSGAALSPPEFFQLAADPQRWRLLAELAQSDRNVTELTLILGRPQNLLSYHLAELRRAGVVTARKSSADRRDSYYRVDLLRCGHLMGEASRPFIPHFTCAPSRPRRRR